MCGVPAFVRNPSAPQLLRAPRTAAQAQVPFSHSNIARSRSRQPAPTTRSRALAALARPSTNLRYPRPQANGPALSQPQNSLGFHASFGATDIWQSPESPHDHGHSRTISLRHAPGRPCLGTTTFAAGRSYRAVAALSLESPQAPLTPLHMLSYTAPELTAFRFHLRAAFA